MRLFGFSKNMESLRLGIFDINGTIHSNSERISSDVTNGFRRLHDSGVLTTVITGRGFKNAKRLIGAEWDNIVSPNIPLCVENGAKVVTQQGENVRFSVMKRPTIQRALNAFDVNSKEIEYLAYYPVNSKSGAVLYLSDSATNESLSEFTRRHGQPSKSFENDLINFERQVFEDKSCMMIIKPRSVEIYPELSDSNIMINGKEINLLEQGVDKGSGVRDLSELTGVSLTDIFVAGNDFNDLPMLRMPVGRKYFVGKKLEEIRGVSYVSSPNELGNCLGASF